MPCEGLGGAVDDVFVATFPAVVGVLAVLQIDAVDAGAPRPGAMGVCRQQLQRRRCRDSVGSRRGDALGSRTTAARTVVVT